MTMTKREGKMGEISRQKPSIVGATSKAVSLLALLALLSVSGGGGAEAFAFGGGGGSSGIPPRPYSSGSSDCNDGNNGGDDGFLVSAAGLFCFGGKDGRQEQCPATDELDVLFPAELSIRGGSTDAAKRGDSPTLVERVTSPFRSLAKRVKGGGGPSESEKAHADAMAKLRTTRVKSVTAPNSTVLPDEVVNVAARRSGLLGGTLTTDKVQECARHLTAWYRRKGYVLHSVTGATLHAPDDTTKSQDDDGKGRDKQKQSAPPSGTAVLTVHEPRLSKTKPVDVVAAKEVVLLHPHDALNDSPQGREQVLSFRQYKEKLSRRLTGTAGRRAAQNLKKSDLNTTFIEAKPRTSADAIARTLELTPGKPFKWNPKRWRGVLSSGVFGRVLSVGPKRNPDGTVTLEVVATESPPRSLEYGVSRSLYTGGWEGELDFEHSNLLGGGEKVGLIVRRGALDPEPSVKLRFHDDRLGAPGGYDVEVFSDYIGKSGDDSIQVPGVKDIGNFKSFKFRKVDADAATQATEAVAESLDEAVEEEDGDALLDRRGVCLRLQDPLLPLCPPAEGPSASESTGLLSRVLPRRSDATFSVERASTRNGVREYIGSTNLGLGPVRRELGNTGARTDLTGNVGWGARVSGTDEDAGEGALGHIYGLLPYWTGSVTGRQIFPLFGGPSTPGGGLISDSNIVNCPAASNLVIPTTAGSVPAGGSAGGQPIELALSHTLRLSTPNLPRHEMNAIGYRSGVRGYGRSSAGSLRGSVVGTAEIRVPVTIPRRLSSWLGGKRGVNQDGGMVLFADWMVGAPPADSEDAGGGSAPGGSAGSTEFNLGGCNLFRRSSVGVGLRKSLQGIPIKYDVCVTADGRVGAFVGLGRDFDV